METKSATEQIKELAESQEYRQLEFFIAMLEEDCPNFFLEINRRSIKRLSLVLKKRIKNKIRKLSSDKEKMNFYRLVYKLMPAFPRFYRLNL